MEEEKLITNPEDIRLVEQDQVEAILGKPPGWILSWGISVMFVGVLLLIWMSWLIKFPDVIPARVILTTEVPPTHLVALSSGKIDLLFVKDKQPIQKGDSLVLIENSAVYEDVKLLSDFIDGLENKTTRQLRKIEYPKNLILGELQNSYSTFTQNLSDYKFFNNKKELYSKTKALKSQIASLSKMNISLISQEETLKSEKQIAKTNWDRMKGLLADGTVSVQEAEAAESEFLRNKRELEKLQTETISNNLRIKDLELTIINLKESRRDGKNEKSISLNENIDNLRSDIENWRLKYLINATSDGIISFPKVLNKNQFVKSGEKIMTIVPEGGVGEMVGRALLPAENNGKVETKMRVNIRLDGYPYQEFGVIQATVKSKSLLPQDGNYLLELELPDTLITTYDELIPFQQEMAGVANIITEDRRILERILDRFLSLIKNR